MNSGEIRQKFLDFFENRGHKIVPSSSLIPKDDPSVLFTTAGMQQFKPYFVGQADPVKDFGSKNTVSVQKCIRTSDIDEVGDDKHLTFFEMLGNFSFGEYFKREAIQYAHGFITKELELKIDYVTVFAGDGEVPKDEQSETVWRELGIKDVRYGSRADNFWGPTGDQGPCGPTTEIYINGIEIWNIVFNEYYCRSDGALEKLKTPGVDTGMGLERLAAVLQKKKNIFETDLFERLMRQIPSGDERARRIVADHIKAAVFIIADGVKPSNTDRGYVLRRLIRRAVRYGRQIGMTKADLADLVDVVARIYQTSYSGILENSRVLESELGKEIEKFEKTLDRGLREFEKIAKAKISGADAFRLFSSYGFPIELTEELAAERGLKVDRKGFEEEFKEHQKISKTSVAGKFAGGLADHEPQTIKHHSAHHLLLAALKEVLGPHTKDFGMGIKQRGSHINSERLRMDFTFERKLTPEELKKVEDLVNQKIEEGLEVIRKEMPREEAVKIGAEMEFGAKYPETVSVYFIQDKAGNVFSKEFCGGPHVKNTSELGHFKIFKEEAVSAGVRRIKAKLE